MNLLNLNMMQRLAITLMVCLFATGMYAQKVKQVKGDDFGAGIESKTYVAYGDMLDQLSQNDTVAVAVMATVNEVCQVKGCWMTLQDNDSDMPDMMVRFKDYGFFMPKDIGGRDVIIEGEAYATVVSVDELRHYAEDAGKSPEEIAKITEPEKKYAFLASGVRLVAQ